MKKTIQEFIKTKNFLVCVDSDGCAMDTMDVKHEKCFGPEAVAVWQLQAIKDVFLETWLRINLYTRTRGINRFKGLVATFEQVAAAGYDVPNLAAVKQWVESTTELSNPSLKKAIEQTGDEQLQKTLEWSNRVNQAIKELPEEDNQAFPNVKESLAVIANDADIAIVSSANSGALQEEWTKHSLAPYISVMCGQEAGTKSTCIAQLKAKGYETSHVLMIGDAPGDLEAALQNGVFYYPILVGKEGVSWERFIAEGLTKFLNGTFGGAYQEQLIEEFYSVLK